jgi:hypothetical protein
VHELAVDRAGEPPHATSEARRADDNHARRPRPRRVVDRRDLG